MVDYTAMDAPTMLAFVRDDAWKWSEAFMQTVESGVIVDRVFMIGWFANAIEHSHAVRRVKFDADLAALSSLWSKLGVDDQTAAVRRIEDLLETEHRMKGLEK